MRVSYSGYYATLPRSRWRFDSAHPLNCKILPCGGFYIQANEAGKLFYPVYGSKAGALSQEYEGPRGWNAPVEHFMGSLDDSENGYLPRNGLEDRGIKIGDAESRSGDPAHPLIHFWGKIHNHKLLTLATLVGPVFSFGIWYDRA